MKMLSYYKEKPKKSQKNLSCKTTAKESFKESSIKIDEEDY